MIQAQMCNIYQYLEHEIVQRNEAEVLELINSIELENIMEIGGSKIEKYRSK
jgi:hypothetical protein